MVRSPTGYPIQSPYLAMANRQAELMMRIASEFRLHACKPQQDIGTTAGSIAAARADCQRL
jgi:hypothetical protein